MVNTATPMTAKIRLRGDYFYNVTAIPYLINYDTINTDLQIDKLAGQRIMLIGMELVKGAAYNPIFKSNSTQLIKYELAANSGRVEPLCPDDPKIICITEVGEALNFTCDVALPPFLVWVAERQ